MIRTIRSLIASVTLLSALCAEVHAGSTFVKFDSVFGPFFVRMYDTATPQTVANFLAYANDGDFTNTFIHRSVPGFVVQGGLATFGPTATGPTNIPTLPPVINEPGISNTRGTIAMAKVGGQPNSATSQWFFNLANNSANLDAQNGGFTAFGRVIGTGMTAVDQMAAVPVFNAGGPYNELPLRNYAGGTIQYANLVSFTSISVVNFLPGDYDFNGVVNNADFTVWKNNYGSRTNADPDGNGNGVVDAADYNIWRDNVAIGVVPMSNPIPEPAAVALAGLAMWGLSAVRRWR